MRKLVVLCFIAVLAFTNSGHAARSTCEGLFTAWTPGQVSERIMSRVLEKGPVDQGRSVRLYPNWSIQTQPGTGAGARRLENRISSFKGVRFRLVPQRPGQLAPIEYVYGAFELLADSPDFAQPMRLSAQLPDKVRLDSYSQLVTVGDQLLLFAESANSRDTAIYSVRVSEKLKRISFRLVGTMVARSPRQIGAIVPVGAWAFELYAGHFHAYRFTDREMEAVWLTGPIPRLNSQFAELHSASVQAAYPNEIVFTIPIYEETQVFTLHALERN